MILSGLEWVRNDRLVIRADRTRGRVVMRGGFRARARRARPARRPGFVAAPVDATRCAFTFRRGWHRLQLRADVARLEVLEGHAHLFNGALIPALTFERFGLPDMRLFVRGDEVDFLYRVVRGGGLVATVTAAIARHPSGMLEAFPLLGGRLFAVCPADPARARIMFRNRGYIARRHGLWWRLPLDGVRYALFFLLRWPPDRVGFGHWLSATVEGWREHLGAPQGVEAAGPADRATGSNDDRRR